MLIAFLLAASVAVPALLRSVGSEDSQDSYFVESTPFYIIEDEAVAMAEAPAFTSMPMAEASGTKVRTSRGATVDYSNAGDGYIMVKFDGENKKIKVRITGPDGVDYTYDLAPNGGYNTFPLTAGKGTYRVTVFKNIARMSYSTELYMTLKADITDEFAPFLRPNQYIDYSPTSACVLKAKELTAGKTDVLEKVQAIYKFVVKGFTYDREKAANLTNDYIPDLEQIYESRKGICMDYASLMSAMLRSQGVPTKMIFGYSGSVYHAWISVYSEKDGWISGVIYFDGSSWKLMDPTFASTQKESDAIMSYIGNGTNYTGKYAY